MDEEWKIIKRLIEVGYSVNITCDTKGVHVAICHKTWVTDNLAQSVPLPTADAPTILQALQKLLLEKD